MTSEMLYNYVTCFKNAFSISGDLRLSGVQISLISDTGPILAIREPCPFVHTYKWIYLTFALNQSYIIYVRI